MNNNKKVMFFLKDYSLMGGIERVTANLIKAFLSNNINVFGIWSLENQNTSPFFEYDKSLEVIINPNYKDLYTYALINKVDYIIVQNGDIYLGNKISVMFKGSDVKVISVIHTSFYHWIQKYYIKDFADILRYFKMFFWTRYKSKFLMKKLINNSAYTLFVSKNCMMEVKDIFPEINYKIGYIYNISMNSKIDIDINNKENLIVFVGRLEREKQVFKTVKILAPLLVKNKDWKYLIIGEGSERKDIEDFLTEKKVDNIICLGAIHNVNEIFRKSKICLLYSFYEGLPTVLLEAAQNNNALLAYNGNGGSSDIVVPELNGYLIDEDIQLYNKVKYLINNPDILEKMMFSNLNYNKFFEKNIIIQWQNLLDEI